MKKLAIGLLMLLCARASDAQESIVLKPSEVFPFLMGQQLGTLGGQILDARQYTTQRQAAYAKLDLVRSELAKCGRCDQRDRLEAQLKPLRDGLLREDGMLCGAFDAMAESNPAVAAMKRIMGFAEVCERYFKESSIGVADAKHARDKSELMSKVKAGDVTAYAMMGRKVMTTFRHLSLEKRLDMACPYWVEGARQNDRLSIEFLAQECAGRAANPKPGQ